MHDPDVKFKSSKYSLGQRLSVDLLNSSHPPSYSQSTVYVGEYSPYYPWIIHPFPLL